MSEWIGCLRIPDVSAWALASSEEAEEPFLVVESGQVAGASRQARRQGVEQGMPVRKAESLCEEATAHPRDSAVEEVQWEALVGSLNALTPRIEPVRPGLAWFEPEDGEKLRRWLEGAPCHCGIAPNRPVARLAARKASAGRIICIREEHEETFLLRTPVEALADVGFSEELVGRLSLFGYPNVGDTLSLTKRHLEAQFGEEGRRLHGFLHPEPSRVSFYSPPPSVKARHPFERDVSEPGPLREAIQEVAADLESRLGGTACQRLILRLFGRAEETQASRVLREPRSSAGALARAASTLLTGVLTAEREIESLELEARGLRGAQGSQAHLFRRRPALKKALATVQKKQPGTLFRVRRTPEAVFEEDRYTFEPVTVGS